MNQWDSFGRFSTRFRFCGFYVFWVVFLLFAVPAIPASGAIIYVDADANDANNGTSWIDAYTSLQSALSSASSGDQIWVAAGTYKPGSDRTDSFRMENGVAIYGGFAGNEDPCSFDLAERDFDANETILSGDIGTPADKGDNSYHVVVGSGTDNTAIIDGFTIADGNANAAGICPDCNDHGGGMFNWSGSPTVANCSFISNLATAGGGGMFNGQDSSPIVINCAFNQNTCDFGGGGMANDDGSSPNLTDCTFENNWAGNHGGGLANWNSSDPCLVNCTFAGNEAVTQGGGINNGQSSPTMTNCLFNGNSATNGGGMYNSNSSPTVIDCNLTQNSADISGGGIYNDGSSPTVTNCIFSGNFAYNDGGGMRNYNSSSPTVINCTFTSNSANDNGGGIYNSSSSPMVENCTFTSNSANDSGGGIYNSSSSPMVENCTFTSNSANDYGGGIYNSGSSSPMVVNCAFSGNSANNHGGGMFNGGGGLTIANCTFINNGAIWDGGGMYTDSGDTVVNCTFQANIGYRGGGIFINSSIETVTNCIFWGNTVNPAGADPQIYGATAVTYCDVQNGTGQAWFGTGCIDVDPCFVDANAGDLRLTSGSPCIDTGNNESVPGGITTDLDGKFRFANDTVDMGAHEFQHGPIHNITQDFRHATIQSAIDYSSNGDQIEVSPGTYYESINFNNKSVRLYSSDGPEFTTIDGNSADHVVKCVSGEDTNTILEGFTITGGNADGDWDDYAGGGMLNAGSSPTVKNCRFQYNNAAHGGGMFSYGGSSPAIIDCSFSDNTASLTGGGMDNRDSSPTVINCTFADNTANGFGGGIYDVNSSPMVTNCIFWGNMPDEIYVYESSPTVTYSNVQGGWSGDGGNNIDADPCFVDAAAGYFRLGFGSPCIDAGDNTSVPASVLKDLAGKLRYADDPCTPDTGEAGTTGRPVVDMGAYEFQGCGITSQNLLANPGFETGNATGWITNWGWSLAADTNEVHQGNYSGLASGRTASWNGAWQSVLGLMDDGKTYRISGWVRLDNADSNHVALVVKKTDSSGTDYYGIDNATGYNDQWILLDGTFALDVTGELTGLHIYFEGPAPGVNFYVDDAAVTEVKADMSHDGSVDLIDFSLFASYYGFDCATEDCGRANLNDCDDSINELDLAILCNNWLAGK